MHQKENKSNQTKPKIISQTCLRCYVLETWENPMFNLQNNSSIFVKKTKNWGLIVNKRFFILKTIYTFGPSKVCNLEKSPIFS